MLPKWHILFGILFSVLVYLMFNITIIQAIVIFSASVFIDLDHYIFAVKRNKIFSLKTIYNWHKNLPKNHKPIMHIFHTLEFLILIFFLSFYFKEFLFILIGMLFHSILDIIDMIYNNKLSCREFSFFRYIISDKRKYLRIIFL